MEENVNPFAMTYCHRIIMIENFSTFNESFKTEQAVDEFLHSFCERIRDKVEDNIHYYRVKDDGWGSKRPYIIMLRQGDVVAQFVLVRP